jgi:hypothetical protein
MPVIGGLEDRRVAAVLLPDMALVSASPADPRSVPADYNADDSNVNKNLKIY